MPPSDTAAPAGAPASRPPRAGATPLPPANPRNGDQLCPATAADAAAAARPGRRGDAINGPTAPLATSRLPAMASGAKPATRYSAVPETVPVPNRRRSTPRRRAASCDHGTAPARYEPATTATGTRRSATPPAAATETGPPPTRPRAPAASPPAPSPLAVRRRGHPHRDRRRGDRRGDPAARIDHAGRRRDRRIGVPRRARHGGDGRFGASRARGVHVHD